MLSLTGTLEELEVLFSGNVPSIMGMPLVVTPHLGSFSGSTWTSNLFTQSGAGTIAETTDADPLGSGESNRAGQYDVPLASVATEVWELIIFLILPCV